MFDSRIKSLQDLLPDHAIDALLITSTYNVAYLTGIFAFSIEEREARVLVTRKSIYLFTDARYTGMVKDKSPFVELIEISAEKAFSESIRTILNKENIKTLGFEEDNITYKEISLLEEKIEKIEFIPYEGVVESLRTIKDNNEVENIKNACQLSDRAFEFIIKKIKKGITELEIKTELENYIRQKGGEVAFPSIVAFGVNSAIPHHQSSTLSLQTPNIVLLDFGAKVNGYCSDMTRTVFIGEPTKSQIDIYNTVRRSQEIAIESLKMHMKEEFESNKPAMFANSHLRSCGFSDIPHGLGHGVGLQVHETPSLSPYSDEKIMPNMIVTVEPGIYVPENCGVRIEDTILITTQGLEILTQSTKEIIIL